MIEIDYYYSSTKKWFIDFAAALSTATGEQTVVEGNKLVFPPALAEGRYEFYELGDGLGVILTDCVFHKSIRLNRKAIYGNEHYKILFNISKAPIIVSKQSGRVVDMSHSIAESVLFTSHTTGISIFPAPNQAERTVQVIFDRTWGVKHFFKHSIPLRVKKLQEFANYAPMQFVTKIDARSLALVEEILADEMPVNMVTHYLTGCACQLVALFFNHTIEEDINAERMMSEEAMHIIQLKEKIAGNLDEPLPTMEEAARLCFMSRTKFAYMFKTLYNNSYSNFFYEMKLNNASVLLAEGYKVADVAEKVGYHYVNHFVKQFKDYFGYSPKDFPRA